jgi:aspartyl-tRNA(Asn)/glutamyl-tRNA(Gln) amidotransferase subunit A
MTKSGPTRGKSTSSRSASPQPLNDRSSDPLALDITAIAPLIRRKKLSPVELLESVIARIEKINPQLNAFITIAADSAREDARRAEREIRRGKYRGPLHGIPIPIKDNIATKGIRTTSGSKFLANHVPTDDAEVVTALREAGAIIFGKTNLHEFAYGTSTENPHYGSAHNPWDTTRIAGGSSGGSAVAVATGMGFASVGTDTGGSIRIPASLCGVVGLKPTYARVSTGGVTPLSRSLDHVGPLARSVEDAALLLEAIAPSSHPFRSPFRASGTRASQTRKWSAIASSALAASRPTKPTRVHFRLGWPREYFFARVDEEVERAIHAAVEAIEKRGARVEEISLPHIADSSEAGTVIALAEATEYHQSQNYFPAHASGYGEDVRQRLEQGANIRAVDYIQALAIRETVLRDFQAAFTQVDAIVAPSTPIPAPHLTQALVKIHGEEETTRSALVRLNRPANFTGLPAISIPCGQSKSSLPIGLQLIAPAWQESPLLQIAAQMQSTARLWPPNL